MERRTRKPVQKRSLEKYERIIAAADTLFNEDGYHKVTTADIAKKAGVATGSVYSYFQDKKDIYIEILKRVNDNFYEPTHEFWTEHCNINIDDRKSVKTVFRIFVQLMIKTHDFSKQFHDDLNALSLLDADIAAVVEENNKRRDAYMSEAVNLLGLPFPNEDSRTIFMHYAKLLIDDVCHQILFYDWVKNENLYIEQAVELLYRLVLNLITPEKESK